MLLLLLLFLRPREFKAMEQTCAAIVWASCAATVVLPTPPFPLRTSTMCLTCDTPAITTNFRHLLWSTQVPTGCRQVLFSGSDRVKIARFRKMGITAGLLPDSKGEASAYR